MVLPPHGVGDLLPRVERGAGDHAAPDHRTGDLADRQPLHRRSAQPRGPLVPSATTSVGRRLGHAGDRLPRVEHDLRLAYQNLQHEIELVRRRQYVAQAQRIAPAQLELELAQKLAALDTFSRKLREPDGCDDADE